MEARSVVREIKSNDGKFIFQNLPCTRETSFVCETLRNARSRER